MAEPSVSIGKVEVRQESHFEAYDDRLVFTEWSDNLEPNRR
jgi:hypothetical protein